MAKFQLRLPWVRTDTPDANAAAAAQAVHGEMDAAEKEALANQLATMKRTIDDAIHLVPGNQDPAALAFQRAMIASSPMPGAPGAIIPKSSPYSIYAYDNPYVFSVPQTPKRRPGSEVTIDTLRMIAEQYDVLRACIQHMKREVSAVPIQFVARDADDKSPEMRKLIATADKFFSVEGGLGGRGRRRSHFESEWIEDLCVVGAAAIFFVPTLSGKPHEIISVDAGTIRPRVDAYGWPGPGEAAYEQWVYGIKIGDYTAEQIRYDGVFPISYSPYFKSPVEYLLPVANAALRAHQWNQSWLTHGNTPSDVMALPDVWTPEQIKEWSAWWDALLEGSSSERQKTKWVPGGTQRVGPSSRKDQDFQEFELWLLRRTCAVMGVSPAAIGFAGEQYKVSQEASLKSTTEFGVGIVLEFRKALYDNILLRLGLDMLECINVATQAEEASAQAQRINTLVNLGVMTINEARALLGSDPIKDGDVPVIGAFVQPLSNVVHPPQPPAGPGGAMGPAAPPDAGAAPPAGGAAPQDAGAPPQQPTDQTPPEDNGQDDAQEMKDTMSTPPWAKDPDTLDKGDSEGEKHQGGGVENAPDMTADDEKALDSAWAEVARKYNLDGTPKQGVGRVDGTADGFFFTNQAGKKVHAGGEDPNHPNNAAEAKAALEKATAAQNAIASHRSGTLYAGDGRHELASKFFNGKNIRIKFSDPKAKQRVEKATESLFGGRQMKARDWARLVGAMDGSEIEVGPSAGFGGISISVRSENVRSQVRNITPGPDNSVIIHNSVFELTDKAREKFPGLGTLVSLHQVESLREFNAQQKADGNPPISTIYLHASGDGETKGFYNGYYTWARLGYDGNIMPEFFQGLAKSNPDMLALLRKNNVKTTNQFFMLGASEGRQEEFCETWRNHGVAFSGGFSLEDGSRQVTLLHKYQDERGFAIRGGNGMERAELFQWERKCINRLRAGNSPQTKFVANHIPAEVHAQIQESLEYCKTSLDVHALFSAAREEVEARCA